MMNSQSLFSFLAALLFISSPHHPVFGAGDSARPPFAGCVRQSLATLQSRTVYAELAARAKATPAPVQVDSDRTRSWVGRPVPGLYQSIPAKGHITVSVPIRPGSRLMRSIDLETEVTNRSATDVTYQTSVYPRGVENPVARFTRLISKTDRSIQFAGASRDGALGIDPYELSLPSFVQVPGTVPLVEGRGIPVHVAATLVQMKLAQVPYGGLEVASTNGISNERTIAELMATPEIRDWVRRNPDRQIPPQLVAGVIMQTHTGRYLSTVLTQSGHRISKVNIFYSDGRGAFDPNSLGDLLSGLLLKNHIQANSPNVKSWMTEAAILERNPSGLIVPYPYDQWIPMKFLLELELEPIE